MEPHSSPVLAALYWIRPAQDGDLLLLDCEGRTVKGETEPPLSQVLAVLAGGEVPAIFTLRDETGRDLILEVWPTPGLEEVGLAIEARLCDRLLSQPLEKLVNDVAHDVRNYAFTMGLQAELGLRRTTAQPEASGHFEAVIRQIDTLKTYLDRLLLYGRPITLQPRSTEVVPFVRELIQSFQFSWSRGSPPVSVSVETEGNVGTATWDPRLFGVALADILDNAARSAEPPPPVVVRLGSHGQWVEVSVTDNGEGMTAETIAMLTVPMAVRRPGGIGLGLPIARKVVTAHGGELTVSSSEDGTTVVLTLPREAKAG